MITITTTNDLAAFCDRAKSSPYVTIDTEFLRERTYYSKLCLVQLAVPGDAEGDADRLDPLVEGLSLEPLYELFRDTSVVKVFHAARQDLEIFFIEGGVIPEPLFDTQVAAMVCGFGEQVGYETLVRKIAHESLDKTLVPATNHPEILLNRKMDPGPLFPWQALLSATVLKRLSPEI